MKVLRVCYNLVEESVYPYCFWLSKCTQNCQKPRHINTDLKMKPLCFFFFNNKKRVYYGKCCIINVK